MSNLWKEAKRNFLDQCGQAGGAPQDFQNHILEREAEEPGTFTDDPQELLIAKIKAAWATPLPLAKPEDTQMCLEVDGMAIATELVVPVIDAFGKKTKVRKLGAHCLLRDFTGHYMIVQSNANATVAAAGEVLKQNDELYRRADGNPDARLVDLVDVMEEEQGQKED